MAKAGLPVSHICEVLDLPRSTYSRWRRAEGWPARGIDPLPAEVRQRVLAMLDAKQTIGEIARATGVSRKTIARWRRSRPIGRWRCYCTPFGVAVVGTTCPACGDRAPWAKEHG